VIIVNAAFLAANDPLKGDKEGFNAVTYYADFVFLAIFIIELIVKVIAFGFALHKNSYLRSAFVSTIPFKDSQDAPRWLECD
jgi:hypothetical protein